VIESVFNSLFGVFDTSFIVAHPDVGATRRMHMRLSESDYNLNKPAAAVITVNFTDNAGRRSAKPHPVAMPLGISSNAEFEETFMPAVMGFSNTLGAIYAALSTANVDVSVTFTNPFALINANIGEWGGGDNLKVALLSVFLETAKTATISIPSPVQTIFMASTGPDSDIINVLSASAGLLLPLMEAYADIPLTAPDGGLIHLSDGERIDDSLGTNGLRSGKKVTKKNTPKGLG
jgi:hypothetical protein